MQVPTDARERAAALDTLRGAAILAVFAYHCFLELNVAAPGTPADPGWLGGVTTGTYAYFVPHHLGTFGVQLFFVISGFCIHRATRRWDRSHPEASPRQRWRAYLGRRFWRIYPLYTLVLVVLVAFGAGLPAGTETSPLEAIAVHATFLHTLVPDHINLVNPSFWSLAVEVQWYALYPIVWLAFRRWKPARVMAAAALLALAWRFAIPEMTRSTWVVNLPFRWGLEWMLGAFVAETLASPHGPRGRTVALAALVACAVLAPIRAPFLYATLPPLVFALLVAWAARRTAGVNRATRIAVVAALGRVSYALYLVHQPALALAAAALAAHGIPTVDLGPFIATSIAVFALTALAATLLERLGRAIQRVGLTGRV